MADKNITESGDAHDTESGAGNDVGTKNDLEVKHSAEELTRRVVELSSENKKRKLAAQAAAAERDELAAKLRALEEGQLNEQGKYKELYERTSKELATERETAKAARLNFAKQVITSQFTQAAAQAGCTNPDHLVKFAGTLGILEELDVNNDTFQVSGDSLKLALEKAQKELPYLFSRTAPVVKDGVPKTGSTKTSLSDIPLADRVRMAAQAVVNGDFNTKVEVGKNA